MDHSTTGVINESIKLFITPVALWFILKNISFHKLLFDLKSILP